MLAAGDTFRAAASEQLELWADRPGCRWSRPAWGGPGGGHLRRRQSANARATTWSYRHRRPSAQQEGLMDELGKIPAASRRPAPRRVWRCCWCSTPSRARTPSARPRNSAGRQRHRRSAHQAGRHAPGGGCAVCVWENLGLPIRFIGRGRKDRRPDGIRRPDLCRNPAAGIPPEGRKKRGRGRPKVIVCAASNNAGKLKGIAPHSGTDGP